MKVSTTLFLTLFLSSVVFGKDVQTEIHLGAENSWPPYSDQHGQGISTNIVKAAFAKVGITTKISVHHYVRVLHDVKAGVLEGGYNVTRQENTEQDFIFGSEPILQASAYWYFAPSVRLPEGSPTDLPDGYKVGGIIGYEYGDVFERERHRFKEMRVSRQSQLVKLLIQGRIDAAIMFEEEAIETLKMMGLPENSVQKGMFNHTSDIYLAFSRKHENAIENAKVFDKGMRLLKASGEYRKLLTPTQYDN